MPSPAALRHDCFFIHPPSGAAGRSLIRRAETAISLTMLDRLRHLVVAVVVALGLIVPGMAMAAADSSTGHSLCQAAHRGCADAGRIHHAIPGGAHCRVACIATATLPDRGLVVRPVVWTLQAFIADQAGMPPGRSVAPDPLPPRPLPPI